MCGCVFEFLILLYFYLLKTCLYSSSLPPFLILFTVLPLSFLSSPFCCVYFTVINDTLF